MSDTPGTAAREPRRARTGRSTWTLLRVAGVPVRVDLSWLVIAGLVIWLFFQSFSDLLSDLQPAAVAGAAATAALLFFASILAHEVGHAVVSLQRGIEVIGITLFLFGGVTESASEAKRPRDEFVIVGVGPFISLVLAALFGLAHTRLAGVQPAAAVLGYLAWFNLALAVFNVIPAYPLDGGRLLRSILWMVTRRPHRSTRWAARVGQAFAAALIALGVWTVVGAGGGFDGVWQVLIGFFLYRGAADAHQRAVGRERLADHRASDFMGTAPPALDPAATVADVVDVVQQRPSLVWPVGDPVVGVLQLADIDRVAAHRWALTRVAEVAQPLGDAAVPADAPMEVALDRMARTQSNQVLVTDEAGRVVGLLTPSLVSTLLRK